MKQSTTHTPTISVVMSAFNEADFVREALDSILTQTFQDFEIIVVDDASTDETGALLDAYAQIDSRITVLHNRSNIRMAQSVNKAMKIARGSYIVRMDADDISLPTRFEKQLAYLQKHTQTVAIGSQCYTIDENGSITGEKLFPTSHDKIYDYIYRFVPVQQPSMMIARDRLPKNFIMHSSQCRIGEEIELLFKLFQYGKVENMPQKLLKYRIHTHNTSFQNVKESFMNTFLFRIQAIFRYGYRPSLTGVLYSLCQATAVFLLPQFVIMKLYTAMRIGHTREHKHISTLNVRIKKLFSFHV